MSWTKREILNQAYGMFGLTNYAMSLTPEQFETAGLLLDSLMASVATTEGIRIGYNQSATPAQSDANQDSGIPDFAVLGVSFRLAELLAQGIGRTMPPDQLIRGKNAFDALQSWCMSHSIPDMQYARNTPRGGGNKPYRGAPGGVFYQPGRRLDTGAGDAFIDASDGSALSIDTKVS